VLVIGKPVLLLRLSGAFLLRLAERRFLGLLFQVPPRSTRRAFQGTEPHNLKHGMVPRPLLTNPYQYP